MTIKEFIKENEYDRFFKRQKDYKEYTCYEIWNKRDIGAIIENDWEKESKSSLGEIVY